MKNTCLHCEKPFFGRSDKQFCSVACKNAYHNLERRQTIEYRVDTELHRNRAILQKLMPTDSPALAWPRELLEQHGFRFDLCTGMRPGPGSGTIHVVYDFEWHDAGDRQVIVLRVEPEDMSEPVTTGR